MRLFDLCEFDFGKVDCSCVIVFTWCTLQGSPFSLTVKVGWQEHTGVWHCCTFCSSEGSKEATCACGGVMPGKLVKVKLSPQVETLYSETCL